MTQFPDFSANDPSSFHRLCSRLCRSTKLNFCGLIWQYFWTLLKVNKTRLSALYRKADKKHYELLTPKCEYVLNVLQWPADQAVIQRSTTHVTSVCMILDSIMSNYHHQVNATTVRVKPPPLRTCGIFPKRLGIFQPNFMCLLCVPIYAKLKIFIQLSATLTKLCHIKHDHPVHIMWARCSPLAETYASIFWHFPKQLGIFCSNFTHLLYVPIYARLHIFYQIISNYNEVMSY